MTGPEHIPVVIIGGGILGLLCAHELAEQTQSQNFMLLDKSPFFGDQTSARNSAVLHSGLYYPKDSLKLAHCKKGLHLWEDYHKRFNIGLRRCGKYILAKKNELTDLENLFLKGVENEIGKQRWISDEEKEELSNYYDFDDGFFIESTSTIDIAAAIKKISLNLEATGNFLLTSTEVLNVKKVGEHFLVETSRGEISCNILINLAGGGAVDIRKMLGLTDIENEFVKGHYIKIQKDYYNKSLIYPIPLKNLKGLGLHTSFDSDGSVRFGPDTLDITSYNYEYSVESYEKMVHGVVSSFKGLNPSELKMDFCGIRPKIKVDGELFYDFWYQSHKENGLKNYIELLGIESPGLTASPSLAKMVSKEVICLLQSIRKRIL